MPLSETAKYTNPSTTAFLRRFSCDGAARPSATPSRQRRAGVNEDTAETSVLRGLARLNRLSLIWLTFLGRISYGDGTTSRLIVPASTGFYVLENVPLCCRFHIC